MKKSCIYHSFEGRQKLFDLLAVVLFKGTFHVCSSWLNKKSFDLIKNSFFIKSKRPVSVPQNFSVSVTMTI